MLSHDGSLCVCAEPWDLDPDILRDEKIGVLGLRGKVLVAGGATGVASVRSC